MLAFLAWEFAYQARFFWLNWPGADYSPDHVEYLKAALVRIVSTCFVGGYICSSLWSELPSTTGNSPTLEYIHSIF